MGRGDLHMSKITRIQHRPDRERYWIFIDGGFCCSIRERTFPAMGLKLGQQITCAEVKEMEKFHWKKAYGARAWDKEKVRLDRVKEIVEGLDERLSVRVIGFGADSREFIPDHPEEAGKPDLEVRIKGEDRVLALVEVTGTERFRGGNPPTYWVRPDKLAYAKNHPDEDVWILLHYAEPQEHIVAIKPDGAMERAVSEIEIRGATEHYVVFSDEDPECVPLCAFASHLKSKL